MPRAEPSLNEGLNGDDLGGQCDPHLAGPSALIDAEQQLQRASPARLAGSTTSLTSYVDPRRLRSDTAG